MNAEPHLTAPMKAAMRRLAGGVVIVTTRVGADRMAMVLTAVNSLSLEPPSLLVCINRAGSMFVALAEGAPFCVNVLGEDHEALARRCSTGGSGDARFSAGQWQERDGLPHLADAQAALFCANEAQFAYGSHGIFVGRVRDILLCGEPRPLVYADAKYGRFCAGA